MEFDRNQKSLLCSQTNCFGRNITEKEGGGEQLLLHKCNIEFDSEVYTGTSNLKSGFILVQSYS